MVDKEITKKAEELVSKIEAGDTGKLSDEMNKMPLPDQLELVREMDRINEEHRKTNPDLPDIKFETYRSAQEHLQDIYVEQKTGERGWYNPMRWISGKDGIDTGDVYDAPTTNSGNAMLQRATAGILSRNRQLAQPAPEG